MPGTSINRKELYNSIWSVIHIAALSLRDTEDSRNEYISMLKSLKVILPDKSARMTLRIFMDMTTDILNKALTGPSDKNGYNVELFTWTYNLHNFATVIKRMESLGSMPGDMYVDRGESVDFNTAYRQHTNINSTKDWGPFFWNVIHGLSLDLDTYIKKESYQRFIWSLRHTLPCSVCSNHLREKLQSQEFSMDALSEVLFSSNSRRNTFAFTVRLHNNVNRDVGNRIITFEEATQIHPYY